MRRIYLIRHGHPDFPIIVHMCLGRTDTPLGALGRMQACLLGESLRGVKLTAVFSSPLTRCRETAAPLGREPVLIAALAEQDMGPWDGLDFDAIRAAWPDLYARRAAEPLLVPPGAETLGEVQRRVLPALEACLEGSRGDIAVVAHASVIQALLAAVLGVPLEESRPLRPGYTGCAVLRYDSTLHVAEQNRLPELPLTSALAGRLLEAAGPGARVEAHCRAVAAEALRIAGQTPLPLDAELLEAAALLHDAARGSADHARLGAAWLRALGYPEAAALVEQHHDWRGEALDEAAILYLADKCVQEDRRVTLRERFAASEKRCKSAEALSAHARRYEQALRVRDRLNALCGRTIVE